MNLRRSAADIAVVAVLVIATAVYLRSPAGHWTFLTPFDGKDLEKLGGAAVWQAESAKWWISTTVGMAAMLLRTRLPVAALAGSVAMSLAHVTSQIAPLLPLDLATPIALYTVAAGEQSRRWVSPAAMLATLGASITPVLWLDRIDAMPWGAGMLVPPIAVAAAWFLGNRHRERREFAAHRVRELEHERDRRGEVAASLERARIARELHDVVAHGLAIIVLQAQAASGALERRPATARSALDSIETTGRESLAEMRRLLGLSRPEEARLTPLPSATEIATLAERVRAAGLPVTVELTGDVAGLPAGVALSVYRIAQEALTNSLKHAGGEATATVKVHCAPDAVHLTVFDTGRGAGSPPDERRGGGLYGMRERVAMLGGVLVTGDRPGGGFQIRARLPLERQS